MQFLEIGDKVTYRKNLRTHEGVIHGVRVHENEQQQIKKVEYVIDTGEDQYVLQTQPDEDGNTEVAFRQPKFHVVDQSHIKTL